LDYMITYGIDNEKPFQVEKPIGRSDHLTLKLKIEKNFGKMKLRKELKTSFEKVKKDRVEISEDFIKLLSDEKPYESLLNMIDSLKKKYKPRVKKHKNSFQ